MIILLYAKNTKLYTKLLGIAIRNVQKCDVKFDNGLSITDVKSAANDINMIDQMNATKIFIGKINFKALF